MGQSNVVLNTHYIGWIDCDVYLNNQATLKLNTGSSRVLL